MHGLACLRRWLLLFVALLAAWVLSSDAIAQVRVRGYHRKDGTYVRPHYRSAPDGHFLEPLEHVRRESIYGIAGHQEIAAGGVRAQLQTGLKDASTPFVQYNYDETAVSGELTKGIFAIQTHGWYTLRTGPAAVTRIT